jgi:hypothetical protein
MGMSAYSEVECNLCSLILDIGEETCLLIGSKLVCEGSRSYERGEASQQAARK